MLSFEPVKNTRKKLQLHIPFIPWRSCNESILINMQNLEKIDLKFNQKHSASETVGKTQAELVSRTKPQKMNSVKVGLGIQ